MEKFNKSKKGKDGLIADVDCTAAGEPLCKANGVQGYPTIKYGSPANLKDYNGGRGFKELAQFAAKNLGPVCGPDNVDLCSAKEKAEIDRVMALTDAELDAQIKENDKKMADAEAAFEKGQAQLQQDNQRHTQIRDDAVAKITKDTKLGLLKSIKADRDFVNAEPLRLEKEKQRKEAKAKREAEETAKHAEKDALAKAWAESGEADCLKIMADLGRPNPEDWKDPKLRD